MNINCHLFIPHLKLCVEPYQSSLGWILSKLWAKTKVRSQRSGFSETEVAKPLTNSFWFLRLAFSCNSTMSLGSSTKYSRRLQPISSTDCGCMLIREYQSRCSEVTLFLIPIRIFKLTEISLSRWKHPKTNGKAWKAVVEANTVGVYVQNNFIEEYFGIMRL